MSETSVVPSLRDRTRDVMRTEAANLAIPLFLQRGFEETTIDDLCGVLGMSRRTFFRYFGAKEDIVLNFLGELAAEGCGSFVARPHDEDVWSALGHIVDPFLTRVDADHDTWLALAGLITGTPALQAGYLARINSWRESLTAVITARLALDPADEPYCATLASAALGVFTVALGVWAERDGHQPLADLVTRCFASLAPTGAGAAPSITPGQRERPDV